MKKRVWMMNHYAGRMYHSRGGRHYNFAKYLKRAGYEPVVFCANSKHGPAEIFFPDGALWHEHMAEEIRTPFVFVKARTYTGNGKQRVLNMMDFYRNVKKAAKEYAARHGNPDVIYASSVHPLTLVAGIQLAKKFDVKCVCEVRDLWPESLVCYGSLTRNSLAARALYAGERLIYKKAGAVVFTMEGAYDYIRERGWEKAVPQSKVHYINNGVDLEAFQYNRDHYQVEDSDLDDPDTFKVIYTGSIRRANHIENILNAAGMLQREADICFLIYGDGDERAALEKNCPANVMFKGFVDKKYVPYILSKGSVNLWSFVESGLLKYGVSPNKLFEYLASGRPTVGTGRAAYNPLLRWRAGIEAADSSPESIRDAVLAVYRMSGEDRSLMGERAWEAAEEYDFKRLTERLVEIVGG